MLLERRSVASDGVLDSIMSLLVVIFYLGCVSVLWAFKFLSNFLGKIMTPQFDLMFADNLRNGNKYICVCSNHVCFCLAIDLSHHGC